MINTKTRPATTAHRVREKRDPEATRQALLQAGADVIAAGPGGQTIRGRGGNDRLCGGAGRDRLIGGKGRDRLIGDAV